MKKFDKFIYQIFKLKQFLKQKILNFKGAMENIHLIKLIF